MGGSCDARRDWRRWSSWAAPRSANIATTGESNANLRKFRRARRSSSNQEAAIRRKLEDPAYRELLRQAQFVNKLIDQRQLSLTELSARLAGLLPEDAHLTGLALISPKKPGDDYMVRMGITAKSEDAVETFINDLEDSPDFKDVSIINQGFQEEASQGRPGKVMLYGALPAGSRR